MTQVKAGNSAFRFGYMILRAVRKCRRRQVAEGTVGPMLCVIPAPRFYDPLRVVKRQELMHVQTMSCKRPLKDSTRPLLAGLSGRVKSLDNATVNDRGHG